MNFVHSGKRTARAKITFFGRRDEKNRRFVSLLYKGGK